MAEHEGPRDAHEFGLLGVADDLLHLDPGDGSDAVAVSTDGSEPHVGEELATRHRHDVVFEVPSQHEQTRFDDHVVAATHACAELGRAREPTGIEPDRDPEPRAEGGAVVEGMERALGRQFDVDVRPHDHVEARLGLRRARVGNGHPLVVLGEHERLQAVQHVLARPVVTEGALTPDRHEAGVEEHVQVFGDGGRAHVEFGRDAPGRHLLAPDQPEDLAPDRRVERGEEGLDVTHEPCSFLPTEAISALA